MTKSISLHNATFAAVLLASLAPLPALAQRSVEYGYKDRIFEQKYLLPDTINALQAQNYLQISAIRALATGGGDLLDPRLVEAAGGTCALIFIVNQPTPVPTPVQAAIDKMPKTRQPQSDDVLMQQPALDGVKCMVQMRLFQEAFTDSLSMDHQLAALAQVMRIRFADEWLSPSELADALIRRAAARVDAVLRRCNRLLDRGISLPAPFEEGDSDGTKAANSTIRKDLFEISDDAVFAKYDAALTAAEENAARTLQDRQAKKQAEEQRAREERLRAEEAARQAEHERLKEAAAAKELAQRTYDLEQKLSHAESAALSIERNITISQRELGHRKPGTSNYAQEESRLASLRSDLAAATLRRDTYRNELASLRGEPPQVETRPGAVSSGIPDAAPNVEASSRTQAEDQQRREEAERQRQEGARRAEISRFEGRLTDLDRTISRLQTRLASQQGAILRSPLNPQNALSGIAGMGQLRAELDQAQAERFEVARSLDRLRKAATASASRKSQPAGNDGGDCRQGTTCRVIEVRPRS